MEKIILNNDIKFFCVAAESFPEGVVKVHDIIHALVPYSNERKYFGLSRPEGGKISYIAAAEELISGELAKHGIEERIIPKGSYQCVMIKDFMNNIPAIGAVFEQLIQLPNIDPDSYCIEWYLSDKDVRCMIRVV